MTIALLYKNIHTLYFSCKGVEASVSVREKQRDEDRRRTV